MAHIELIVGPMFSGKSTELIRRCDKFEAIGFDIIIINHSLDTRCSANLIQTHSKNTKQATKTSSLMNWFNDNKHCLSTEKLVLAIDEAQFFNDLILFIESIENFHINILIAGLDGDCQRKEFGEVLKIIPYCDNVTKLNAMCMIKKDGTMAPFTKKLKHNTSFNQIDVGGADKFMAVCREEYLKS